MGLLKRCAKLRWLVCFDWRMWDLREEWPSGLPKPLQVGFLIEGMSGKPSGTWTRFESLVVALSSAGVEVHVRGTQGIHDSVKGLPTKSWSLIPKRSPLGRFFNRRREIDSFALSTGVQIVHLEAPPFTGAKSVPTIASIHDLRAFYPSPRFVFTGEFAYQRIFLRVHLRKVDRVLALTEWSSGEIQRVLSVAPGKIAVVPPIVRSPPLRPTKRSSSQRKMKYAIALGHLEPRKNLQTIIAASASNTWPQDVQLLIAGSDQGSLEEIAELNCSLGGKAVFLGPVSDEEKWELLRGAAVVLLPSLIEGFGIVAVEAPNAGTPVLVARGSSLGELGVHPSALVETESPEKWAKAVRKITRDTSLRGEMLLRQKNHARLFGKKLVLRSLFDCYREVLST